MVDDRRSYWKSCIDIDATEPADRQTSVEESFCQYVLNSGSHVVVTDARTDPRTHDNPSIDSMSVAAWAGYPIHAPGGEILGTFCVADTLPRDFTPHDLQFLDTLSHAVAGEIALRGALDDARQATRDRRGRHQPGAGGVAAGVGGR